MFKILVEGCKPIRTTEYNACIDVFSSEDMAIMSGETVCIGLGIAIDSEKLNQNLYEMGKYEGTKNTRQRIKEFDSFVNSHYLQLMLQNSLAVQGLILPNGVGIICLDYPSQLKMIIHNLRGQGKDYKIKKGDRIGKMMLLQHSTNILGIKTKITRTNVFESTRASLSDSKFTKNI